MSSAGYTARPGDVAIVGMAGRFPGAATLDQFWRNLRDGVESVTVFSDAELLEAGVAPEIIGDYAYVKAGGVLADAQCFDARFSASAPRKPRSSTLSTGSFSSAPGKRWRTPARRSRRSPAQIGVYAGASMSSYLLQRLLRTRTDAVGPSLSLRTLIGNDKDYLTTRVSYQSRPARARQ